MRITVVLNRQEAHNDSLIGVYIGTENKVRKQVINEMCIFSPNIYSNQTIIMCFLSI